MQDGDSAEETSDGTSPIGRWEEGPAKMEDGRGSQWKDGEVGRRRAWRKVQTIV